MDNFFSPKSVAVIGVSESPTNMAARIVENLIEFGFKGVIHQVGRSGGTVFSRKIYTSVLEIEDPIELAVVLTPAATIPKIMEECGKKGIKHVVIESAGFREHGEEGKKLEEKIVAIAQKYKIRFIGPNCIGTMDMYSGLSVPFVSLKDNFRHGGISAITQSGGVGFSYLTLLGNENFGLSKFASIGNKLNVDENDLLEFLIKDEKTDVICMYLESISDGRRLIDLANKSPKPILIHKANTGRLASSIAKSHTAALSSDDAVVSAAFKQAGIARVSNRESTVNTLKIMPLPRMKGNRLAIISRSGGHAIIAADASEAFDFELAPLSEKFLKDIEKNLRGDVIKLTNPIDIGDLFDYDAYAEIVEKTLKLPEVDGVVFMHLYVSSTEGELTRALLDKIAGFSEKYKKPVGICVAVDEKEFSNLRKDVAYPIFSVPFEVIRAMAYSRDFYLRQKNKERGEKIPRRKKNPLALKIIKKCINEKRNPLLQEGLEIFRLYGIPIVESLLAKNEDEAVRAGKKLECPVVMKIVSQEISHKTEAGGVRLGLEDESQIRKAYRKMISASKKNAPQAKVGGVVVQPLLKKGWELILGAKQDKTFGPIVLAGLGGIFVEIFKDSAIRVVPFRRSEAGQMLKELKGYPILRGARGDKPYDVKTAEEAIVRLSHLISDFPEIKEIDINPFYIFHEGGGGFALDARIIL